MLQCKELIVTSLQTTGKGTTSPYSPVRRMVQVYEKDGTLIAQNDTAGNYSVEDLEDFAIYVKNNLNLSAPELVRSYRN